MRLLLCNDDGIRAPGLAALERALSHIAPCVVVAPEVEQSATSHAFTMHRPVRLRQDRPGWYAVDATPADSVYVGLHHVCAADPPDLVVSGINRGANVCQDALYSGTVAAALEAVLADVPAMAVSMLVDWSVPPHLHHWETPAAVAATVARAVLRNGLPKGSMLNVNVPDVPLEQLRGVRFTRMGRRAYRRSVEVRTDPRGRPYCWLGGGHLRFEDLPDSDGVALRDGYASITPLHPDLTCRELLPDVAAWPEWQGDWLAGLGDPSGEPRS